MGALAMSNRLSTAERQAAIACLEHCQRVTWPFCFDEDGFTASDARLALNKLKASQAKAEVRRGLR